MPGNDNPFELVLRSGSGGIRRCGEQDGRFYDRRGYYFREGVNPRNNFGRLIEHNYKSVHHSSVCVCGEPQFSTRHVSIIDG